MKDKAAICLNLSSPHLFRCSHSGQYADKPSSILFASYVYAVLHPYTAQGRLMRFFPCGLFPIVACALPAFATVTVTSPTPGSTDPSPVHYIASATASTCSKGVASTGIYVNNKLIYVANSAQLNTSIAMNTGPE